MSTPTVDTDLVARICRDATARSSADTVVDAVRDPLDDTTWVRLSSLAGARARPDHAQRARHQPHDLGDGRLHVTGWDLRLLHWRLGTCWPVSMT